jgi:molybdopterin-containing oxidoreductase family iron-sulfur binding subunit
MSRRRKHPTPWIEPLGPLSEVPSPERDERDEPPLPPASRRDFLRGLGIGAAVTLTACQRSPVRHALPYLVPPEEITPGVPVHYASTCTACPAACGLMVSALDGRPVKLEGHPGHPLSKGGLCAIGQADVRALYDAGRLQGPTLGGKFVTFAELDAHVLARLGEVREAGKKVFVLAPTLSGPTARETVARFLAPYGGTLVEHDPGPASSSALLEAYELLTGRPLAPALDLAAADLVVSLGGDPLATGPEPVAQTQGWAARRRESGERGAPRLVQIEGSLSLTGAAADERWSATAAERRALALHIVAGVAEKTGAGDVVAALGSLPDPPMPARAAALVAELVACRGRSLLVSASDDLAEQLAVAIANRLLGNEGKTLDVVRPSLVRRGLDRDLAAFLADVESGAAGAVFVLDLDPVDELPGGEALGKALAGLPLSVAVTDRPTATAAACGAVAAAHHALERWGDFEPRAGLVTFAQPTLRPLYGTRHPMESLLRWSGDESPDYRERMRTGWETRAVAGAAFSGLFTRALQNGMSVELSAALPPLPPLMPDSEGLARSVTALAASIAAGSAVASKAEVPALEVELVAQVGLGAGRSAHVPWLRELPDPLTRVSWTGCVRLAPSRAEALGVADGDHVKVEVAGRSVTLPARILPGQDPRVLGVPVGFGRKDGDGGVAGRNGYRLARLEGRMQSQGLAATAAKAAGHEALPLMQPHGTTEGRPVVYQLSRFDEAIESDEHHKAESLWPGRPPTVPKWEMVIDLDACTGCSGCVVACQAENNLPVVGPDEMRRHRDMYWLRIDRYFVGDVESPDVLFEPMLCSQCENAPCETVCPVAATVHSEDGLNQQVYNRCVGTRYCANNCPYKVRRFNWFDYPVEAPVEKLVLNPNVVVRSRGVMEKCTFCVQRIQATRIAARRDGHEDWRGLGGKTACQESCPAKAITFGDATDPRGEVAAMKKSPRAFQVLAELGVRPAVTYLAKVRTKDGAAAGKETA